MTGGLDLHRQLNERIAVEIRRIEQEEDSRVLDRYLQFNELLAKLPRADRL